MTALSRASLEQGRLERAARQLLVSGTILRSTQDQIGVGFSDYLLGCVYRQMGDWAKSIAHLTVATERFRDLRHERYLRRTLFELTKSYLLKKDWDGAQQSLASAKGLGEQMLFRENTATRKRSEAVGELLFARVKFATGEIAEAEACIQSCWAQIATLGADIKAQAHIIRGEILLWQKKFSSSIRECETGLRLKPADVTDRAWLILIAAEAHLRRGDLDGAKQWFSQWEMLAKEIENQILRERALKLESALDAEKASFYISYADPSEFTYEKVNQDLRRFLVQHVRAFKHGESQEEQARALGISRQTYSNWLAELRDANLLVD
jgi:tetratricopeptide (TPR) repeat protein